MIRPKGDNVLVKPIVAKDEVRESGIIIPATVEKGLIKVQVLAVGDGNIFPNGVVTPLTVKVGDFVLIRALPRKRAIIVDSETLYFVHESDLLCIVEE